MGESSWNVEKFLNFNHRNNGTLYTITIVKNDWYVAKFEMSFECFLSVLWLFDFVCIAFLFAVYHVCLVNKDTH